MPDTLTRLAQRSTVTASEQIATLGDSRAISPHLSSPQGEGGGSVQADSLDVQAQDLEQLHEINLVSDLMIACSECPQARLPQNLIDAVLAIAAKPS